MTDQKDIYRSARIFMNQHGEDAERIALAKMRYFMDKEEVVGASAWLMIAQAIKELQKEMPPNSTVH